MKWRPVRGYETHYEVSDFGDVRRIKPGQGARCSVLKPQNVTGYNSVGLCRDGVAKPHLIHRLVAEAFIRPMEADEVVNHLDGNKKNNTLDNIEITTTAGNNRHSIEVLGNWPSSQPRGEEQYLHKLTDEDVRYIISHKPSYGIATKLAKEFGVSSSVVSKILHGLSWKHIPRV